MTDQDLTPEAQLQTLIHEAEIRRHVTRFARHLDERQWEEYASLYADDAILELPHGRVVGRTHIQEWVAKDLGRYRATQHAGGLQEITIDGDTATVYATLLASHIVSDDGETFWLGGGWYEMHLRRTATGWLFSHVRPRPSWLLDIGAAFPHRR